VGCSELWAAIKKHPSLLRTALQLHKFRFRRFKSSLERQAYADTTISWHYFFRKGQKELAEAWAAMLPDLVSITVRRLAYVFVNASSSYGYDAVVPGVSNTPCSVTSQKIRILSLAQTAVLCLMSDTCCLMSPRRMFCMVPFRVGRDIRCPVAASTVPCSKFTVQSGINQKSIMKDFRNWRS
jgi:hypothetical protein